MTDESAHLALHTWLSPAFPVGGFAFSHGLEWAVDSGDIRNAADLRFWLDDLLGHGAIRADVLLLCAAWREPQSVGALNELALALAPSFERHLETSAQGTAFLEAVANAWPAPALALLHADIAQAEIAYPIALGVAAAAHAIPLRPTLQLFVLATVGNLVSAVLRLGPIGQSEAQKIIADMAPAAERVAAWAEMATLDDLGTCAWRSDIATMRHETQYSRLFRS